MVQYVSWIRKLFSTTLTIQLSANTCLKQVHIESSQDQVVRDEILNKYHIYVKIKSIYLEVTIFKQ